MPLFLFWYFDETLSSLILRLTQPARNIFASNADIRALGILFIFSGVVDLVWILSYPDYALKVFGTTFSGWVGMFVKLQHPVIHGLIGWGFWKTQRWSYLTYLVYLVVACLSETMTQVIAGYHPTRTTMIVLSLLFGLYIVSRRSAFR